MCIQPKGLESNDDVSTCSYVLSKRWHNGTATDDVTYFTPILRLLTRQIILSPERLQQQPCMVHWAGISRILGPRYDIQDDSSLHVTLSFTAYNKQRELPLTSIEFPKYFERSIDVRLYVDRLLELTTSHSIEINQHGYLVQLER